MVAGDGGRSVGPQSVLFLEPRPPNWLDFSACVIGLVFCWAIERNRLPEQELESAPPSTWTDGNRSTGHGQESRVKTSGIGIGVGTRDGEKRDTELYRQYATRKREYQCHTDHG